MHEMIKQIKTAIILLIIVTLITSFIYPGIVTLFAHIFFSEKANGSLLKQNDVIVGSKLIGQFFNDPGFFWGRPSATTPYAYNAANSKGSNLGPSNPDYLTLVKQRINFLKKTHGDALIPYDLISASGSGLDPEISVAAAIYQVERIAKARGLAKELIQSLVDKAVISRSDLLGEPRVNVLELNLALQNLLMQRDKHGITAQKS